MGVISCLSPRLQAAYRCIVGAVGSARNRKAESGETRVFFDQIVRLLFKADIIGRLDMRDERGRSRTSAANNPAPSSTGKVSAYIYTSSGFPSPIRDTVVLPT